METLNSLQSDETFDSIWHKVIKDSNILQLEYSLQLADTVGAKKTVR